MPSGMIDNTITFRNLLLVVSSVISDINQINSKWVNIL